MAEGYTTDISNSKDDLSECQNRNDLGRIHINPFQSNLRNMNPMNPNHTIPRTICRYFRKGTCQFGDRCKFVHSSSSDVSSKTGNRGSAQTEQASTSGDMNNTNRHGGRKNSINKIENWVNAPEFVPGSSNMSRGKSYAEVTGPTADKAEQSVEMKLCPYMDISGTCLNKARCKYLHADLCDLCGVPALHPFDKEERKKHTQECIQQHERDMELSFAVARSKEKSCGVCFEVIMEKASREQRFGILPNCNHCFCLTCIRKWRQARQFDNKIIRACPECRVTSDFVCPSMYWVDTKEEKEKLIDSYKGALARKDCKYFKQGRGKCPFGNKCFYLHALPDGTKRDVGPPPRQPRRQNHEGDIDVLQQFILWDFLDDRENNRWLYSIADDLEDLVAFFSDSEDSDWSEYDFFFD